MTFYRYTYTHYANGTTHIHLDEWRDIKETPCGYWIVPDWSYSDEFLDRHKKWIPKESKSRFAYPDKEKAWINFKMRTKRRIEILEGQLKDTKRVLSLINQEESK